MWWSTTNTQEKIENESNLKNVDSDETKSDTTEKSNSEEDNPSNITDGIDQICQHEIDQINLENNNLKPYLIQLKKDVSVLQTQIRLLIYCFVILSAFQLT